MEMEFDGCDTIETRFPKHMVIVLLPNACATVQVAVKVFNKSKIRGTTEWYKSNYSPPT